MTAKIKKPVAGTRQLKSKKLKGKNNQAVEVDLIPEPSAVVQLTDRQRAFVEEYLTCWNASEAARRVGYRGKANVVGPRLLANVSIDQLVAKRIKAKAMKADEVLARMADHARGTLNDFFDQRGHISIKQARAAGKMHLLKSYSKGQRGTRIEIYDAQAALEKIAHWVGMYPSERNVPNLNIDLSQLTTEQLGRIANGEDPLSVLAGASASGTGTTQTPSEQPSPS